MEWTESVPPPGSEEPYDFVVELSNAGSEIFEWPDPCPIYHWTWGESATEYGAGYGYLNCAGLSPLAPGEAQKFRMELPAPEQDRMVTLGWELVDPRSCNWMTLGFLDGEGSGPQAGEWDCPST